MTTDAMAMSWIPGDSEHVDTVEIRTFGFWVYLMSDLVLFSALFATFAVVGFNYAGGPSGRDLFDLPYLFGETMFLLVSSAACGFAMLAVHRGRKAPVLLGLVITFLLVSVSLPWKSMSFTAWSSAATDRRKARFCLLSSPWWGPTAPT